MKYDVLIIGGGLGGLVSAAIMARSGRSVCVLEKNDRVGGCLQSFKRHGAVFDTGVHYVGGLDAGQVLWKCFRYMGILGELSLKRMDSNSFDVISFDGDSVHYPYAMGYEAFAENLSGYFPSERDALRRYVKALRSVSDAFPLNRLHSASDVPPSEYFSTSVDDFLSSITVDKRLKSVLAGTNLLYAGISNRTPMYVHALVIDSYLQSAYRLVGGSEQLAEALIRQVVSNGGVIQAHAEVVKVSTGPDGAVDAVVTADGARYEGRAVISDIHPTALFAMTESSKLRRTYLDRIASLKNTISCFSLYAVMKKDSFPYADSNIYHYRDENVWSVEQYGTAQWPSSFFLSMTPETADDRHARAVNVLTCMRMEDVSRWRETRVERRGDDYRAFKEHHARLLLDFIDTRLEGFSGAVERYYTATPLTYRDYTATPEGSMYGVERDCTDYLHSHLTARTKIPNLFLAGQNVYMHGITGVVMSAVTACGCILGTETIINDINRM